MEGDKDVKGILYSLKYTSAESLKATQRKFAAARNTIDDEALSHRYKEFFSSEEQETLRAAARILGSFKNKIEHAKEIRAREEKLYHAHQNHCKGQRTKLLDQYLPRPTTMDQHRDTVVFHLALQDHCMAIAKGAYFSHGIGYIESDLERGLDEKYSHLTVKNVAQTCWQESYRWLDDNLWRTNVEPERSRIETVMQVYRDEWRSTTLQHYKKFFDEYEAALTDEFDRDAATGRAKEAVKRRAGIKVIK